jgi:YspA, cpYpsA-related SLOG family
MRVVVTGGREYDNYPHIFHTILRIHTLSPITMLAHGNARGADKLSGEVAKSLGIRVIEFPVKRKDWDEFGMAAGPMRNQRMLDEFMPDLVIAFPGGNGTADMVRRAVELEKLGRLRVMRA